MKKTGHAGQGKGWQRSHTANPNFHPSHLQKASTGFDPSHSAACKELVLCQIFSSIPLAGVLRKRGAPYLLLQLVRLRVCRERRVNGDRACEHRSALVPLGVLLFLFLVFLPFPQHILHCTHSRIITPQQQALLLCFTFHALATQCEPQTHQGYTYYLSAGSRFSGLCGHDRAVHRAGCRAAGRRHGKGTQQPRALEQGEQSSVNEQGN
jgi:hypothetical protein